MKIPRLQLALVAGSAGLALLATCVYATAALGSSPCVFGHRCRSTGPIGNAPSVALGFPNGGPISPSIGEPAAIALLSRIQRAYRHTPGVELATTRTGSTGAPRRFLLTLHNGTVTAEAFIGPRGLAIVRRTGGPTFSRATAARCWRRLGKEDPRTLLNVGAPFPENGKIILHSNAQSSDAHVRQITIETADGLWYLASPVVPSRTAYKTFLTATFDPASYSIRSIVVRAPDHSVRATQTVTPLTAAPPIPTPTPTC